MSAGRSAPAGRAVWRRGATGVIGRALAAAVLAAGALAGCGAERPDAPPAAEAPAGRRVVVAGVDLTGVGFDRGEADAPIVIVELSDFGCPFCGSHARQTFPSLDREFIATGKVFYKYVPFVMGMFPNGDGASRAAQCAAEQDAFWPMHDTLYAVQNEWKRAGDAPARFTGYAAGLGLDTAGFGACLRTDGPAARRAALADDVAAQLGIRATPTFLVNGRPIEGALPLDRFRVVLTRLWEEQGG